MKFFNHHLESVPLRLRENATPKNESEHKSNLQKSLMETNLSDITEDDCAIFPRLLPVSYLHTIEQTARAICEFGFHLLSQPINEVKDIFPKGPIRDFLIEELQVLQHRSGRIVGSMRLDLAIVGEPTPNNPPKLLEINEIGFDGLSRSSVIQKTILHLLPELRSRVLALDAAENEIANMRRVGSKIIRLQEDCYNWDEEYLYHFAKRNHFDLRLICPKAFGMSFDREDFPLMSEEQIFIKKGRVFSESHFQTDAYQMSFALSLEDYRKHKKFFRALVRSKTTGYGPFLTGLIASKMILVLLNDSVLRKKWGSSEKILRNCILPAAKLDHEINEVRKFSDQYVLKHVDGFGGEMVFLGEELKSRLKKIPSSRFHEWIVQQKIQLNLLKVDGINSKPRKVISDLGVFVHYDWSKGRFRNFKIGGFITRATNRSYKVNVSGGGIQVPVVFLKGK